MAEILQYIDAKPTSLERNPQIARTEESSSWYADCTWNQTRYLAVNGWPEETELIEEFSSRLEAKLGAQLNIDEYFYDVTGQDFDLDRVLIGEPEAWLNTEQVEIKAPALHTLRLVINIGASSDVNAETLKHRGAAVVALVSLLERTRRSVEVVAITRDCSVHGQAEEGFDFNFTVKQAGQEIDLSKLAFVFMHAGMLRRIQFACMETTWVGMPYNYGHSSDLRKPEADIYIGCSHSSNEVFLNDDSTEAWILEELKKQGVELKGEG